MAGTKASDERWIEYEIGDLLRQVRLEEDISLKHVARALEMDHVSIYGWEKGIYFPATLARLGLWSGALKVTSNLIMKKRNGSVLYSREL